MYKSSVFENFLPNCAIFFEFFAKFVRPTQVTLPKSRLNTLLKLLFFAVR